MAGRKGVAHNRRVRGRDTWTAEDRRLKRHLHGRIWRKRGFGQTWTAQVNNLDRRPRERSLGDRLAARIILVMALASLLGAGGRGLLILAAIVVAYVAWRRR